MTLPGVRVVFERSDGAGNPQLRDSIFCVVGYSTLGTRNEVMTLGSEAACRLAGHGEGIEAAAAIGNRAGWPVYLVPINATKQAPSAVVKTPSSAGVPLTLRGSVIAPGAAPPLGAVGYVAVADGVTVAQVSGGANGVAVTGSPGASVVTVTFAPAATNGTIATLVNGTPAAAALLTATALGGSGAVAAMAATTLDNGALVATPLQAGVTVSLVYAGNSTPLSIPAVVGTAVVINGPTDANGLPTGAASAIVTYLNSNGGAGATAARLLLGLTAVGSGAGLAPAIGATALQFGSTGALAASGTGTDRYQFLVRVDVAGTVGGSPEPQISWSCDNGNTFSAPTLVPASGIVALQDAKLQTGITVTLTGAQEVGDLYTFDVALPVVASVDLLAGIDVAIANTSAQYGVIMSPTTVSRATASQIDAKLQVVKGTKMLRGMFSLRTIGEGVPGETEAAWSASLISGIAGFVSETGPLCLFAGKFSHISTYTGRIYKYGRPVVILGAMRKASIALHQSIAETATGPLSQVNIQYDPSTGVLVDRGIDHDESLLPGLDAARIITTRTYDDKGAGEIYFASYKTMAATDDPAAATGMLVNVRFEATRALRAAAFPRIQKPLAVIDVAESLTVPAGAITKSDARGIASVCEQAVRAVLFVLKSDSLPSASANSPTRPLITVTRNNNILVDKTLWIVMRIRPLAYPDYIEIRSGLELN